MGQRPSSSPLFREERRRQIVAFVERHGRATVAGLSDAFSVSATTIRKDLDTLAERDLLERTHGGAIDLSRGESELSFEVRRRLHSEEKQAIGRAAARMVKDGEAIIIDASTTAMAMVPYLRVRRELTVFTNGLPIAMALVGAPGLRVLMPSGLVRAESASLVAADGLEFPSGLHFSRGFFGAKGVTPENGFTLVDSAEVTMKRFMLARVQHAIGLVDSSKWGHLALAQFARIEDLDCVVTDDRAPAEMIDCLRQACGNLVIEPVRAQT